MFKSRWFIYHIYDEQQICMDVGPNTSQIVTGKQVAAVWLTILHVTLLDYMDVTEEEVRKENHGGVGCMCCLCQRLKILDAEWIMKLGTFYHPGGLN